MNIEYDHDGQDSGTEPCPFVCLQEARPYVVGSVGRRPLPQGR